MTEPKPRNRWLCAWSAAMLLTTPSLPAQEGPPSDEQVFELSPFEVSIEGDRGYLANNAISGTRLNTPIQDLPMTLEVVTSELIEDTGASDFNEALNYTAGVFFDNPAESSGANSPNANRAYSSEQSPSSAGAVGAVTNNSITIRGFDVPFQMREGFRIGTSVSNLGVVLGGTIDPVNVDRMEVVRGPGALLYGLSVLSGIVNVIPKKPHNEFETSVSASAGSEDYLRYTLDTTGPILRMEKSKLGELNYRLAYANEERGDWTMFRETEKEVYVAQLEYRPVQKISLFAEYSKADTTVHGIGDQFVYDGLFDAVNTQFRNEYNELSNWARVYGDKGPDFRWSGPDTYYNRDEESWLFDLQAQPFTDLSIKVGAFLSEQDSIEFTNEMRGATNTVPNAAINFSPQRDIINRFRYGVDFGEKRLVFPNEVPPWKPAGFDATDYKTIYYWWTQRPTRSESKQYRAEANYSFRFHNLSDWIGEQNLLAGWQKIEDTVDYGRPRRLENSADAADVKGLFFIRPDQVEPIRYNGEPLTVPYADYWQSDISYEGMYLLYNARLFKDRVFLIAGIREDEYDVVDREYDRSGLSATDFPTEFLYEKRAFDEPIKHTSRQLSASFEIVEGLNVFALYAEGVSPNTGAFDGLGNSFEPETSVSKEAGVKFNLMGGKVVGSLSLYEIKRDNATWQWDEAPSPIYYAGSGHPLAGSPGTSFEPDKVTSGELPISYGIDSSYFDPEVIERLGRGETVPGIVGSAPAFLNRNDAPPQTIVYLDYSMLDEAGFRDEMEAAFADTDRSREDGDIQPYVFSRLAGADEGHSPSNGPGFIDALVTFEDQATGFDFQVVYSPLPEWQIIFNYSHTERETLSGFQMVDAIDINTGINYGTEYDRWVRALGPDAFTDPTRASTGSFGGPFVGTSLFLRSENSSRLWTKYNFEDGPLEGFSIGGGVIYQGPARTALSIGGDELRANLYPTPDTEESFRFDLAFIYRREFKHFDLNLRLNIFNLLDDDEGITHASYENQVTGETELRRTERYYAPRSYRVSVGLDF
ncbi:MAG: TonB-dependent siderophore receptor [Oceanipulchritudo sp.]